MWRRRLGAIADLIRLFRHDFDVECSFDDCTRRGRVLVNLHGCGERWWCSAHYSVVANSDEMRCEICGHTFDDFSEAVTGMMWFK